ncbi:MAG: ribose-5-phosphate isomerase [Ornithinimicrobium sp.]|uniref:ribose-5-phosphate isomerase n=1 Tax=Ornithinimicrobium sp. TaxID=1977084 RepID=UPI003D9B6EC9
MRIHIGGDHAAFDLQRDLVGWLAEQGHEVVDHGPTEFDELDNYPVFVLRAAQAVAAEPDALGIVLGGSGNGEQIAANKVDGIRAALCYNAELATLARLHNNAQVISIGARMHTVEEAHEMVAAFLSTDFTGEDRHQARIDMMAAYEADGTLPDLP